MPRNLPAPSRHNQVKYQPNSQSHYPTMVFEVAVTNESRDRLLEDADAKYFGVETSVQIWVGLKIRLSRVANGETFWFGWGRRKIKGFGLKLEEETEDDQGFSCYLPVHTQANAPLVGQVSIPSRLMFNPLPPPAGIGATFVIPFESVRLALLTGLSFMS